MILNLYGKKALAERYRLSKREKADTQDNLEGTILQMFNIDNNGEESVDTFSFFDIYTKDKTLLKLYPASKDDYENYLEKKLIEN